MLHCLEILQDLIVVLTAQIGDSVDNGYRDSLIAAIGLVSFADLCVVVRVGVTGNFWPDNSTSGLSFNFWRKAKISKKKKQESDKGNGEKQFIFHSTPDTEIGDVHPGKVFDKEHDKPD